MAETNAPPPPDLDDIFTYHPPEGPAQFAAYNEIRASGLLFARTLAKHVPHSRERALALTKIREAVMWANAGVALNPGGFMGTVPTAKDD